MVSWLCCFGPCGEVECHDSEHVVKLLSLLMGGQEAETREGPQDMAPHRHAQSDNPSLPRPYLLSHTTSLPVKPSNYDSINKLIH
jgi:hypothetical protein